MAIFRKSESRSREATASRPRRRDGATGSRAPDGAITIIGAGTRVVGDLVSEGTVRIEGSVHGTVRAAQAVVLGRSGEIVGDVVAPEAVIGGVVSGSVTAEQRLELQSTGVVEGEISTRAQHLQINEGARFSGQIRMTDGHTEPLRALPAGSLPAPESTDFSTSGDGAATP